MDDAGSMAIWEYAQIRVVGGVSWWTGDGEDRRLDESNVIDHLNAAAKDGWELFTMTEAAVGQTLVTKYVLRREVEAS
jgi:hypothetical protein